MSARRPGLLKADSGQSSRPLTRLRIRFPGRGSAGLGVAVALLLLAPAALGAVLGVASLVTPAASLTTLSGAYTGSANVQGLKEFGEWRGAPTSVALDYLGRDGWQDIDQPDWTLTAWRSYEARGGTLVLSVPMLVNYPSGTFAAGATGAYDQHYLALGRRLVADGEGGVILRLGWEFNGTWFPWSLRAWPPNDAHAFVAYWRHLVSLLRSIPGNHFRFDWTVNSGPSAIPAPEAYPGNAYVDYVGVDVYDSSWNASGSSGLTNPTRRWDQIANRPYGLNWWLRFAESHGKPITLPEWGLNTDAGTDGAGDDPSFIQHMHDWIALNRPSYQVYFDFDASALDTDADPQASAEYRQLFGRRAVAGDSGT